jgi:4-diphosphocytidyl-2-C-methyl-D-erythritol kinase
MTSSSLDKTETCWLAPAKLNLFLHVTGRRADGYHSLESVFRLIDVCDELRFVVRQDGELHLSTRFAPIDGMKPAGEDAAPLQQSWPDDADLCVRAARLLQRRTGCSLGADIALCKRIPIGGGLGGGSSDAATTLLALNELWNLSLSAQELADLGLELGADVPFFLHQRNAFARGVGEQLTSLDLPAAWYVVLVPPVAVPTASIFTARDLTRDSKSVTIESFSGESGYGSPAYFGRNDLEAVACRLHPAIQMHVGWLKVFNQAARMTGSGSCVFAEFVTEAQARTVVAALPKGMRGFAVQGLEKHPLRVVMRQDFLEE